MFMILLPILMAAAPLAAAQPVTPGTVPLAGPAVVVLWASWCASCREELARLPSLAAAATPLPVRTLAIDPPERARALLAQRGQPTDGAYADQRDPRTVLDAWGGQGSVLPVAVALDREGRVCGRKLGLLGTDQLRDWATRCSR
jgi:thiol-disulfide isomerase/thioredoxin